jgi:hypothetical protein
MYLNSLCEVNVVEGYSLWKGGGVRKLKEGKKIGSSVERGKKRSRKRRKNTEVPYVVIMWYLFKDKSRVA